MNTFLIVDKSTKIVVQKLEMFGNYSYEDAVMKSYAVTLPENVDFNEFDYIYDANTNTLQVSDKVIESPSESTSIAQPTVIDTRSLHKVKEYKWNILRTERESLEFGGFICGGNKYDSNSISQGRILGAFLSGQDQQWTLADNTVIYLTAAQIKELYLTMQKHISDLHERGRIARQKILNATTIDEVNQVTL